MKAIPSTRRSSNLRVVHQVIYVVRVAQMEQRMNNKIKNKSGKTKVLHHCGDDSTNKHTQYLRAGKDKKGSRAFCEKNSRRFIRDNGIFQNENPLPGDYKHNNASTKTNYSGICGRSLMDPEVLRRQRSQETRVYGENACQALFQKRPDCIVRAWFLKSIIPRFKETLRWMAAHHKAYHVVDETELIKASDTERHGGVCFLIKKRNGITVQQWVSEVDISDCVLALENIGNPHNLGAIIRSCAHFGVQGVLLQEVSRLESGAAIRIAEGGAEYIQPIISANMISALEEFRKKGYRIVITSAHSGMPLFKTILPFKMVLVLGQKCDGLSIVPPSLVDCNVSIGGTGNVESLNISVVAGIFLGEWWRQNKV